MILANSTKATREGEDQGNQEERGSQREKKKKPDKRTERTKRESRWRTFSLQSEHLSYEELI
jgi:hypothetical protein